MTSNNENNSTMPDTDTPSYARMTATYSPEDNKLRLSSLTRLDKETYNRVKAAGFKWAPRQEIFVAPMWAPDREDLLIELCGEIGDEDTSLMERQEQRAERFEEYSDNRKADAEAAHKAVHAIADGIPLGQPILVGHHSEKHARKDAERIENGMRKAVKMWETSTYWTQRAASAIRHAKYKELPAVRARRIKGLESDIRVYRAKFTPDPKQPAILQQRWNDPADAPKVPHVWCAPRGGRGGSWVPVSALPALEKYYSRWIQHCENRLEYERAMLDEQGATDLLKPKPRSAAASLPLCNYSAPGGLQIENKWNRGEMIYYPQVEMTQAEYARIHADYKGTRVVGNSHRVRTAMQRHTLVSVFLTDAKTHTPPGPQEPAPRELREPRIPTPRAVPAPDPQAEQFSAMREILKAGVQVVAAPQLFPTPPDVAARMVELADLPVCNQSLRILEPSAGTGRLIDAAFTHAGQIVAVEKNYSLAERLRTSYATVNVQCEDFLECNGNLGKFDRVLMNPPFENGSDIKHIQHAITFLKPGGRLVAICANGPRQTAILQPLATEWEELPERTFAGTGVRTVLFDGGSGGRGNCVKSSMSKRVALYARVSTSNGQQDPEMQLRELREYAKHRELIIVGEYIDRMTGSKDSRPAINRLMADACQRRFDAVLVWKLDRFGRSLRHLVNAIAELEALGVAFISFRDNLDLTTPSGRLMFQIIGAMAEFERALIQERVRAGLRNAKAKGKTLGRPRAVVNIEEISALREQGLSWAQITHQTGTSKGTAQRVVAALRSKEELLATYA